MPKGTKYRSLWFNEPDVLTGAVRTISTEHSAVHEGCAFYACNRSNPTIAANADLSIEMRIPSGVEMHLKDFTYFTTEVPHLFELWQNPSLTTGSTAMVSRNRHRSIPDDSVVVLKSNPTNIVTTNATLLMCTWIGGSTGVGQSKSGGSRDLPLEWILEEGIYLLRITNNSANSAYIAMELNWYELSEG